MNKISIIIPHYNSRNSLIFLLGTIPQKNWIEIIVVDDNSDFDIFSLKDIFKFVQFYKIHKLKKGAGAARNEGLKYASGNFVLFADADDYFTPNAFRIIKNQIKNNFDVIYLTPTSKYYSSGKIANRHIIICLLIKDYVKNNQKEIFYKFYEPFCKLISTEFLRNYNIEFEEILVSNDVLFSVQVAYYSKSIAVCSEVVYVITDSENSLTKQMSEVVLDCRFHAMVRYNEFLKSKKMHKFQGAMFIPLWRLKRFGINKVLSLYFYCKYYNYPILPSRIHFVRIIKSMYIRSKLLN